MVVSPRAATAQVVAHSPQSPDASLLSQSATAGLLGGQGHTRTYQACIPCRRRKVRCDLGPVDHPHDPPCVRCRRESKSCFFSATRRKRKTQDGVSGDEAGDVSDYEVRNGRKKLRADDEGIDPVNDTDNVAAFRRQPLRRGEGRSSGHDGFDDQDDQTSAQTAIPEDPQATEAAAQVLTNTEVFSGHHALAMLYRAAQSGELQEAERERERLSRSHTLPIRRNSLSSEVRSQINPPPRSSTHRTSDDIGLGTARRASFRTIPSQEGAHFTDRVEIESPAPVIVQDDVADAADAADMAATRAALDSALEAWSRFRFVHQGWFTAREGIQYIEYYFENLAPLSAVPVPDFSNPGTHEELLTTEPMLAITLLTIASRYMPLTGPGSRSRPHAIHEVLWKCLREMIDRLLWGQEQFGGGFCGAGGVAGGSAGSQPGCDVNPLARTGLRTLGSVVSLVVLTEWHPRALHFPPGSDGDSFMLPADGGRAAVMDSSAPLFVNGTAGQPMASWLEPCWRSDRMCWMLLGLANSLAYEIGVYNEAQDADEVTANENENLPVTRVRDYARQRRHVRETLKIYFSQTAGRLGLTSMLPKSMLREKEQTLEARLVSRLTAYKAEECLGGGPPDSDISIDTLPPYELVLHFWSALADLMELGNALMFPNRRRTRDLIKTQQYQTLLQDKFHPLLRSWREAFDAQSTRIPVLMRDVILIEYEYARVYLNSLSLQAVVERCTHNTPPRAFVAPVLGGQDARRGPVPYADLMAWCGDDRRYVQEVTDACRATLRMAVDGLYGNGGNLKHAPVRTYFRVISVAIILLKTFVLGATEDDVSYSLSLLEKCTAAFRVCIVDDVHVSSRFADLCDTLIGRIRSRFVRLSSTAGTVRRRRRRKSLVGDGGDIGQSPRDPHNSANRANRAHLSEDISSVDNASQQRNGGSVNQPYPSFLGNNTSTQFSNTGPFPSTVPTLQPVLSAGTPFWRIPGNGDSGPLDASDEFPPVSILPPPGLSLAYGEDEGLVLGGGRRSESEHSGSQSSQHAHVHSNGQPHSNQHQHHQHQHHQSFSLTSPAIPLTPNMTPIQTGRHIHESSQNGDQYTPHRSQPPPQQLNHHPLHHHGGMLAHTLQQHNQQLHQGQQPTQQQPISDTWDHWDQNWLVLPIDPILGSYGANVSQTTYGPDIGGLDMLDVLLPFERETGDEL